MESTQRKKMCRDLTPLCIVKQRVNRQTKALVIKVRSFCQRPNVALCLKEILLQSPFQCQIIFFIFICIFFSILNTSFPDSVYPQCIRSYILFLHVADLFNFRFFFLFLISRYKPHEVETSYT